MTLPSTPGRLRSSLRTRLVATLLLLTTAGLLVSGFVINNQLSSYLIERADNQLQAGIGGAATKLFGRNISDYGVPGRPSPGSFPAGIYGAVYSPTGQVLAEFESTPFNQSSTGVTSRPEVTAAMVTAARATGATYYTVDSATGGSSYRLLLQPANNGDVVGVGIPLDDLNATLTQLLWLEVAVGLGAILLLGIAAYVIIRAELRPLKQMSDTASEIAAGDLTKRVSETEGGSEVGQLGTALNVMLARIEEAFAARQASEDRLRQFVADASHELRTPLTSIRGYSEMFDRGASNSPADLDTMMRRIQQESTRMSGLVDDMLQLARLDQQRPLQREPVDLAQLVRDVGMDISAAYPSHPLSVYADEVVWVQGDENALRQVIGNLARNACVHTPVGTAVTLSTMLRDDSAFVMISDNGPGIPRELRDEIFGRFTRADSSRARDAGGSGLGLSIVAAITAAHAGEVYVTDTPGGGATFTVTLPVS